MILKDNPLTTYVGPTFVCVWEREREREKEREIMLRIFRSFNDEAQLGELSQT